MQPLLSESDTQALRSDREGRFLRMEVNIPRPSLQVVRCGMRKLSDEELSKKKFPPKNGITWDAVFLDLAAGQLKYCSDNSSSLVDALRDANVYPGDALTITKGKKGLKNVYKIQVTERTTDEKQAAFMVFIKEKEAEEEAQRIAAAMNNPAVPFP